jgi:hypothetical protein
MALNLCEKLLFCVVELVLLLFILLFNHIKICLFLNSLVELRDLQMGKAPYLLLINYFIPNNPNNLL